VSRGVRAMRRLMVLVGVAALASGLVGPVAAAGAATAPRVKVAASAGCGATPAVAAGETEESVDSDGTTYTYIRHVPPAYDGTTPLPVVVDFHGYAEGASIHTRQTMLGAKGDAEGFVTISPQGQGAIPRWDTDLDGPDIAFVGQLLDEIESTLCVDTNRIFATGLSNGAFMTSAVACAYADRIAAVAPVAGIRDIKGCDPARPVPVVAFHGTADTFVTFDGGLGSSALDLPAPDGSGRTLGDLAAENPDAPELKSASIPSIVRSWAKRNDCAKRPTRVQIGADVTRVRYRCPERATVELYRVEGGGHSWPGSAFSKSIAAVVGATTDTIVASDVIWTFFERHPLTKA
jgi:polyhydroxybutyrate depolymerase